MEDINQTVVEKIKMKRKVLHISQNELAQVLNLSVTAYNRIENNKTQLTINNLYLIAEKLRIDVSELLAIKNNNYTNVNSVVMTNFNNGTLHLQISGEELKKIINVVE